MIEWCPRCGAPTVKRQARKGWTPGRWFIGCLDRSCTWTSPLPTQSDIEQERQLTFLKSIFPPRTRIVYLRQRRRAR